MVNKIDNDYIKVQKKYLISMIPYEELPKYDLLSQVIDFK